MLCGAVGSRTIDCLGTLPTVVTVYLADKIKRIPSNVLVVRQRREAASLPPLRQVQGLAAPEQSGVEEHREGARVEASLGAFHPNALPGRQGTPVVTASLQETRAVE